MAVSRAQARPGHWSAWAAERGRPGTASRSRLHPWFRSPPDPFPCRPELEQDKDYTETELGGRSCELRVAEVGRGEGGGRREGDCPIGERCHLLGGSTNIMRKQHFPALFVGTEAPQPPFPLRIPTRWKKRKGELSRTRSCLFQIAKRVRW